MTLRTLAQSQSSSSTSRSTMRMPDEPVSAQPAIAPTFDPHHPLCRGDYVAAVFCGTRQEIGDLAGEPTVQTQHKFAMIDVTVSADQDFARTSCMALPLWSPARLKPSPGVCFVFGRPDHPLIAELKAAGGKPGDDFITVRDVTIENPRMLLRRRLSQWLEHLSPDGEIGLLGFGHQGALIADILQSDLHVRPDRIAVVDSNSDSLLRAHQRGLKTCSDGRIDHCAGVISSPLSHYSAFVSMLSAANMRGVPVFNNAPPTRDDVQFAPLTPQVFADAAAARVTLIQHERINLRSTAVPIQLSIIREDLRVIGRGLVPHVHGPYVWNGSEPLQVDSIQAGHEGGIAAAVKEGCSRIHVSARSRQELGYFAARNVCERLWPAALQHVFPAKHGCAFGATAFERLLQGHAVGRELVATMQSPMQRVVLGTCAAHYSSSQPMIEIGSAFGGSGLLLAAATAAHAPPLYSIDPDVATRDIMRWAFQREGFGGRLHQIVATSDQAHDSIAHLHARAGLVFIDGLHTESGVTSDLHHYADMVAPGGCLLIHDCCPQMYSVLRAVLEFLNTHKAFEMIALVDGLAVCARKQSTVASTPAA